MLFLELPADQTASTTSQELTTDGADFADALGNEPASIRALRKIRGNRAWKYSCCDRAAQGNPHGESRTFRVSAGAHSPAYARVSNSSRTWYRWRVRTTW